jgi:hypothetical protein
VSLDHADRHLGTEVTRNLLEGSGKTLLLGRVTTQNVQTSMSDQALQETPIGDA